MDRFLPVPPTRSPVEHCALANEVSVRASVQFLRGPSFVIPGPGGLVPWLRACR